MEAEPEPFNANPPPSTIDVAVGINFPDIGKGIEFLYDPEKDYWQALCAYSTRHHWSMPEYLPGGRGITVGSYLERKPLDSKEELDRRLDEITKNSRDKTSAAAFCFLVEFYAKGATDAATAILNAPVLPPKKLL
ncbi:hypothetical protein AURDEDRAFT_164122 [Auricularia subglabra TFB-10046 SS5]|nr:hypothetical protein AURDEDRAFT_164122 [Auricularia subglabra TFB-10046 SS5]